MAAPGAAPDAASLPPPPACVPEHVPASPTAAFARLPPPPPPPPRSSSRSKLVLRIPEQQQQPTAHQHDANDVPDVVVVRGSPLNGDATPPRSSRLSNNKRRSRRGRASRRYNTDTVVQDWADDPLADFHELVLQELAALGQNAHEEDADVTSVDGADTMRFWVGGSRASRCTLSAPASGLVSPVDSTPSSPTPPDEQPWRSRWLRRKLTDDDAVLVSITPLPEDSVDDDEERCLRTAALPDLLPATRRAATLPAPGVQQSSRRRPGSGGDIIGNQDAVKRKASLGRRATVKSAGPDLISEDDVPPALSHGGLPLALHNLLAKLRPSPRPSLSTATVVLAPPDTPANTPTSPRSPLDAARAGPRFPAVASTMGLNPFPRANSPDLTADAGTQTSPPLSRSSSFTWVSDSSLPLPDTPDTPDTPGSEDDRCSSTSSSGLVLDGGRQHAASTDDCLSSVDSAGGDSPSPTPPDSPRLGRARAVRASRDERGLPSWGACEEEGHESGIGTASPPPSHPSRSEYTRSCHNFTRRHRKFQNCEIASAVSAAALYSKISALIGPLPDPIWI
ncbi:hypothetical protein FOCC_FOCC003317 [Frankliniella occidentalis]|nr:hypothetical protein FOCC_FOCC003317 [Frankliniella occidentalis]